MSTEMDEWPIQFPTYFHEQPVTVDKSISNIVVVDGIPVVPMERYEKLCTVIRSKFQTVGQIAQDGLYLPIEGDEDKKRTCGYAFVEYEYPEEAQRAAAELHNKKLDAKHTFLVTLLEDVKGIEQTTEEWIPPNRSDFESKVQLNSWLFDEFGRDQFAVRFGTDTHIYWSDPARKANDFGRTYVYGGEREKSADKHWTDLYIAWSTRGSYLATFHNQGIQLWGGEDFQKLSRFAHSAVQHIDFSPMERYLVTSNQLTIEGEKARKTEIDNLIVWDVRSAKKLIGFPATSEKIDASAWPVVRWSPDDKFFARLTKDGINVHEAPDFALLDKKPIKIPGVAQIRFSPTENLLAYWAPSEDNSPATVGIMELPSRTVKREKHLYNVVSMEMFWSENGDFLAIKVLRRKTKKTLTTNFEIFRLRVKDVPIEVVEMGEEGVSAFAWDPTSQQFAVLIGEGARVKCEVWGITDKKVARLHSFPSRAASTLLWSPAGQYLLLAGLGNLNGQFEWIDAENGESLATAEHFSATTVQWDPSGRYVLTAVCQKLEVNDWKHSMDNGYRVWSMQGTLLTTVGYEKLWQITYRPRPKRILSKEQVAEVKATMKEKYWRRFETEDEEIRRSQLRGHDKQRADLKAQWKAYRARKEAELREIAQARRALRGGYASDDESDYITVEQVVEEEISREEELY